LLLMYKGIYFLIHADELWAIMSKSSFGFGTVALAHYIALAHLGGGFLIALGFLTRVSILFQLPILIGAVFFINAQRSVFNVYSEFLLSVVVLLLLVVFLFYGAGIYSMDVYLRKERFYE